MSFTPEMLFNTRYIEGYNLYDPRYIAWLKVSHPEEDFENFLSLSDHFPDATTPEAVSMLLDAETLGNSTTNPVSGFVDSPGDAINLTPVRTDNTLVPSRLHLSAALVTNLESSNAPTSINNSTFVIASSRIADNTSTVISLIANNISTPRSSTAINNTSTPSSSTADYISTPSSSMAANNASTPSSSMAANNASTPSSSMATNNPSTPSSSMAANNASTPTLSTADSNSSMSPTVIPRNSNMISKYLIQYVPPTAEKKKAASTRVTGLRVLTSAEGLAILTEKEQKKKQEKEDKEKRKQERLDKRREKQELAKKKAEEKARNKGKNPPKRYKRKQLNNSSVEQASTSQDTASMTETLHEETSSITLPGCDLSSSGVTAAPDFDLDYQCSEYFGTYKEDIDLGNGAEWVQCECGQWIHEDCIDESVTGEDGKERMCSNYVVQTTKTFNDSCMQSVFSM